MLKFKANGKLGNYGLILPTDLKEITPKFLTSITEDVIVANDYSLVAVCYREKLSSIILSLKQNKNLTTAVVPLFVKRGYTEENKFQPFIEIGDKLLISASQLSLGYHVAVPNNPLNINKLLAYFDGDREAYTRALNITNNSYVYFLEFKIVPNCDIIAIYKDKQLDIKDNIFEAKPALDIII